MSQLSQAALLDVLASITVPYTHQSAVALEAVNRVEVKGDQAKVEIVTGFALGPAENEYRQALLQAFSQAFPSAELTLDMGWYVSPNPVPNGQSQVANVKNIIAIASGKGGVGKSTTTVNLALALAKEGARVGVLDADIYGPSQPKMLGVENKRPDIHGGKMMVPVEAYGVQSISMGYMVTEKTPMIWRGPMVSGALQQLLEQTLWQDLDYLLIDMPPGTGDIQLTLSQKVPVAGSVIVTTPQDIALLDAKKGIEMFRKVNIPVLGVVENMATHVCSKCQHEEHIFGEGGGQRIADEYDADLLGALPLELSIRELADSGKPSVVAEPTSDIAKKYREIAARMAAQLWLKQFSAPAMPEIEISDD